ncbi:MAG: penicillin-binding protein 2 [Pseudomonadota bacterium]
MRERKDNARQRIFSRRAMMILGGQAVLGAGLAARMYDLSVQKGQTYKLLADRNRLSLRFLPPPRGRIVDRFGAELASNRPDYQVHVVPEQTTDLVGTLAKLGQLIRITPADRRRVLSKARRQRSFLPILVRDNLTWEDFAAINVASVEISGIQPRTGLSRYYPDGASVGHLVGHVGSVPEAQMSDDPLLRLPNFKVGREGLERSFDDRLRGKAGTQRVEVNVRGRVVREIDRQDPMAGDDLPLTIDRELQVTATKLIGESAGSAVVLDIANGDILAMASAPSFNPNVMARSISRHDWQALLGDPRAPLVHKSISGQYPPGSTVKMIVALAGLEAGIIDPADEVYCSGRYPLGDNVFHCWKRGGHGKTNLHRSLVESCDTYYYHVARDVGIERIAKMARRFGLGERLGVPVRGEASGRVPDPDWKYMMTGEGWRGGETLNVSIGQGDSLATPLQLAVMVARLVTGRVIRPRLLREKKVEAAEPLGIDRSHLDLMMAAMTDVVAARKGTAHSSKIKDPVFDFAGKTGTSQVRRISIAERRSGIKSNADLPWKQRDHGLFVGFAPVANPQYAISIVVEHGGGGATAAAPLARDILAFAQARDVLGRQLVDLPPVTPLVRSS